jgi:DHA3 family tetracycline resistance protein-like MFS transporter
MELRTGANHVNLFSSLSHRPFALLWSGQTISGLGDSLYRIALAWWVLEKTGSAEAMGTVLIVSFTPMLIFLLIGGVAADRFSRLRLMLASDVLRGLLVGGVAALASADRLELWHLYVAGFVFGLVNAFFQPAYSAIVPELTPPDLLASANSLSSLGVQFSSIAGPALGALIVKLGGIPFAFALDSLSFFVSAACILLVRYAPSAQTASSQQQQGVLHDLRDGFSAVLRYPWIWLTILLAALANLLATGAIDIAMPFFVKNTLRADVDIYGLLTSASAVGSVLGAAWLGTRRLHHRGLLIYFSLIVGVLMIAVVGLSASVLIAAPALVVSGVGITICGLSWLNALQQYVPREKLGRVTSINYVGSFVLIPVGYAVTGWLTDHVGATTTLTLSGIVGAGIFALGLLHSSVRDLD